MMNITIVNRKISVDLHTWTALSVSYTDLLKLNTPKQILQTNVKLQTYTGKTSKPKGVIFAKYIYTYILLIL